MAANTPITPLRVLVTGHVNGNVGSLLSRVNTLGKKAPFDFLLITGDLFPINKSLSDYDTSWITEMQADDVKYQNLPSSIYAMVSFWLSWVTFLFVSFPKTGSAP